MSLIPGAIMLKDAPPAFPSVFRDRLWFLSFESTPCRLCGQDGMGRQVWVVRRGTVESYEISADGSMAQARVTYGDFDTALRVIYPEPSAADALYLTKEAALAALPLAKKEREASMRRTREMRAHPHGCKKPPGERKPLAPTGGPR